MSTVFPNPFDVNGSSAGLANTGEALTQVHARMHPHFSFDYTATLAALGPQPWNLDAVAEVAAGRFALTSSSDRPGGSCARMTANAIDAAKRLNLTSAHVAAIVAIASLGHEGIVDVALGVRARLRHGCVMHVYRLRSRPCAPAARLRLMPILLGTYLRVAGMG